MRGKDVFFDSLAAQGVEYLFGNPGTTESPLMDGLLDRPELSYVLCLHEAVALGAAHYYSQASGRTSVVNLHVAPGLGNALGMLYNAAEAGTPMVVTAGQQDTRMRLREPLLSHDLVAMAQPLVKWSVQAERAEELGLLLHRAFKIAAEPPSGPVFVALPIDVLEQECTSGAMHPGRHFVAADASERAIEELAELLAESSNPALVVGDGVASANAIDALVGLADLLAAPVWYGGLHHRLALPSRHAAGRHMLPFEHAGIRDALGDADAVVLIGGSFFEEVWFTPGSPFPPAARVVHIEQTPSRLARNFAPELGVAADIRSTLSRLTTAVDRLVDDDWRHHAAQRWAALESAKQAEREHQQARAKKRWHEAPISVARLMAELAEALPDGAVIVNEAITGGADLARSLTFKSGSDYYGTRGGGIGQGLPGGIGVKIAHPDRPVVVVSGDGSAMYSIQALWTAAYHELAVVFVILHNREYKILKYNLDNYRRRFGVDGDRPYPFMDLTGPDLDFTGLAASMGVTAKRVEAPEQIRVAIDEALRAGVPYLLDVWIEGLQ